MAAEKKNQLQTVARNRKAYHDYFVEESLEAGISLLGTEVKSVREGRINLRDAWCSVVNGEMFVNGVHISPYGHGNIHNHEPLRTRKLLLHKRQIENLHVKVQQDGYSLIPLSAYFNRGFLKIQVGLCKGKKQYDKRADIAKRDAQRNIARSIREYEKNV